MFSGKMPFWNFFSQSLSSDELCELYPVSREEVGATVACPDPDWAEIN
jgi:hypothetical protein